MAEWSMAHAWKAWLSDSGCRPPERQIMLVASPRNQNFPFRQLVLERALTGRSGLRIGTVKYVLKIGPFGQEAKRVEPVGGAFSARPRPRSGRHFHRLCVVLIRSSDRPSGNDDESL